MRHLHTYLLPHVAPRCRASPPLPVSTRHVPRGRYESQTIISEGETPLMHAWPTVGVLGAYSLSDPFYLILIGLAKLVAISVTVLGGYRGGFIFPFMVRPPPYCPWRLHVASPLDTSPCTPLLTFPC